jgi:NADPH-dependent 2,4-dienoyl-CoA reductase/sulfur reductase-like enzyme
VLLRFVTEWTRPIGLAEGRTAYADWTTGHDRSERGRCQRVMASRRTGFTGEIVVVGAEPHPPYERPPLSKQLVDVDDVESVLRPIVPAD